ncbi:hypothetical protein J3458_001518 [Metarhizium acridum]|uniref:uncharacterized protein n=1 Tax=Metarhizium acridum TaxID=92637 RepID=UPI001C6BA1D7|nr:hypothetical protein J3458_001518 [Metarhizium acridum]
MAVNLQSRAGIMMTTMAEVGISFGFDMYDGITTYLDAVKCRSEELASVRQKKTRLSRTSSPESTTVLSRVRTQPVFSTAAVTECLVSFEAELKALGDISGKAGRP